MNQKSRLSIPQSSPSVEWLERQIQAYQPELDTPLPLAKIIGLARHLAGNWRPMQSPQAKRLAELEQEIATADLNMQDAFAAAERVPYGLLVADSKYRLNYWTQRGEKLEAVRDDLIRRRDALLATESG